MVRAWVRVRVLLYGCEGAGVGTGAGGFAWVWVLGATRCEVAAVAVASRARTFRKPLAGQGADTDFYGNSIAAEAQRCPPPHAQRACRHRARARARLNPRARFL